MSETRDYAAFLQNAGLFFREDSQGLHPGLVCDAPSGHEIGNAVAGPGTGNAAEGLPTGNNHRTICTNGATPTQRYAMAPSPPWMS